MYELSCVRVMESTSYREQISEKITYLTKSEKKCDISYTERDFETEKCHRKWA